MAKELPGPQGGLLEHATYTLGSEGQDGAVAASSTLVSPLLSPQKFFLEFKPLKST